MGSLQAGQPGYREGEGTDSLIRQNRLRMEITHADHGPPPLGERHHHAVGGSSRYFQRVRKRRFVDHQRMITACAERIRKPGEYAAAVVLDRRRAAMHRLIRSDDAAPERCGDNLMPQANTKNRQFVDKLTDDFQGTGGLLRRTWTGGKYDRAGPHRSKCVHVDFIMPDDARRLPQSLEVASEVKDGNINNGR